MSVAIGGTWKLRHWRIQTVLAAGAMAVAVSLPVVLLSVGGGVSDHALHELESSGYQIAVSAPGVHGISGAHRVAMALQGLNGVGLVSPVLSVPLDLYRVGGGPLPVLCEGVQPAGFLASLPPDQRALFPNPLPISGAADLDRWANGTYSGPSAGRLLLSSPIADAYDFHPGDRVRLGASSSSVNLTNYTVAGTFGVPPALLGPTGAFAVILPLADLQVLTGFALDARGSPVDAADTVDVGLSGAAATNPGAVEAVAREIQGLYPFYSVSTLGQTIAQERSSAAILAGFYLALSSAALAVGLLFLALVLVRRVEATRPTIAVRRAVGEPGRYVAADLARQGLGLAGVGAIGGLILGILTVWGIAMWGSAGAQEAAQLAVFDPYVLGPLAAAVIGLGVATSLIATRAAYRISIPEALR